MQYKIFGNGEIEPHTLFPGVKYKNSFIISMVQQSF